MYCKVGTLTHLYHLTVNLYVPPLSCDVIHLHISGSELQIEVGNCWSKTLEFPTLRVEWNISIIITVIFTRETLNSVQLGYMCK